MNNELRPVFSKYIRFGWKFGLALLLLICVPRFVLVLNANVTGKYNMIGIIMIASALIPFILLSKSGRKRIGIRKTKQLNWLFLALFFGLAASLFLYLAGIGFYGVSSENWYVYIARSYNIPEGIQSKDKLILFLIMAVTGMTFSPVGEELFFRGIVHESFAHSIGEKKATLIEALAFSITHLSHFGIVFINGHWDFYPVPALIWLTAMFLVSILFFKMKKYTDSIWGAVLSHSAFNLGMIYSIFYLL
jgi:membrane protease YdiL (CAAX protease family)